MSETCPECDYDLWDLIQRADEIHDLFGGVEAKIRCPKCGTLWEVSVGWEYHLDRVKERVTPNLSSLFSGD